MELRGTLRPSKKPVRIEVVQSKQGGLVPVVNGKFLHSRYDPAGEAKRWVAEKLSKKPNARCAVVLGMGFAYHVEALRELLGDAAPIVVFEPMTEIVTTYAANGGRDIDGVRLWPNPSPQDVVDGISEVLTPTLLNNVLVLGHAPSIELDASQYQSILSCIHSSIDMIAMTLTTGWGFGFEWIENSLRNILRLPDLPFLSQITPKIKSSPPAALVIGAGPSLDDSWDAIRESRVLRFAVDTALEPMERQKIAPHLGFLVDSQAENAKLIDGIRTEEINMVATLEVHPSVFERRWRNLFVASCDEGILSWLGKRGKFCAGRMKQGGSVATCAFDLARQTGCAPIYFGGIDLSFSKLHAYCRGTAYERRAGESAQTRLHSVEHLMYQMKTDRMERRESGWQTQDNMYNYYRWLKDEIGRTAQPVVLLKPAGLLSEFLPAGGDQRILLENFPAGFDPEVFRMKFDPNGIMTREFLKDGLESFRVGIESFLNPSHFSDPDALERALGQSEISGVIEMVARPAITTRRYEIEKGGRGENILEELRAKLAGLLKFFP